MTHKALLKAMFIALFLIKVSGVAYAQDTLTANKWVKSKVWSNGVKLKLHQSTNGTEFYKQYHASQVVWDKVFQFIKLHDLDTLKAGKYPIDGDNAYATITEAPSKEMDKANWESHRNYLDLQYVIKGKEKIGVAPVSTATVTNPYDAVKDVANYTADGQYYIADPNTFFLFFPQDAHRPNIRVGGYDVVKKMVIKIKVAQ